MFGNKNTLSKIYGFCFLKPQNQELKTRKTKNRNKPLALLCQTWLTISGTKNSLCFRFRKIVNNRMKIV